MCTQHVIIKKGENVGTCFDEDVCEEYFIWSSTHDESRVLHDQDVPRRVDV